MIAMRFGASITKFFLLLLLLVFPLATVHPQETSLVPVVVEGKTVRLEIRVYKPTGTGPLPTLVFHHGSTGRGRDPRAFKLPIDFPALASFFVRRGWAVVMPARRGRAGSEGFYEEGFELDHTLGYSCKPTLSIPGADRALQDISAAMTAILAMPFVDRNRVIIGGQSRGGILSVAYAGQHPEQIKGVINFVGGWLGTGCTTAGTVNKTLFQRGASYTGDTLWLYGNGDPFYSIAHSQENFRAFQAVGGKGTFHSFQEPQSIGHRIVGYPVVWASLVESYLKRQGLPSGE
jgi:dienelactone hydrolase